MTSPQGVWRGRFRYDVGLAAVIHWLFNFKHDHDFILDLQCDGSLVIGETKERSEFSLLGGEYRKRASVEGQWDVERQTLTFVKIYAKPIGLVHMPIHYEGRLEGQRLSGRWWIQTSTGTWSAERQAG
ncbi:MAG TPA: hypothetical protein VGO93_20990 [Candidatus Xenobia bacterium]|jgi:hypothetical protein